LRPRRGPRIRSWSIRHSELKKTGSTRKTAPQKFAKWLAKHENRDPRFGFVYQYHPRSDAHSVALCRFILEDLLEQSTVLKDQTAVVEQAVRKLARAELSADDLTAKKRQHPRADPRRNG
jgi:hypothetical protein